MKRKKRKVNNARSSAILVHQFKIFFEMNKESTNEDGEAFLRCDWSLFCRIDWCSTCPAWSFRQFDEHEVSTLGTTRPVCTSVCLSVIRVTQFNLFNHQVWFLGGIRSEQQQIWNTWWLHLRILDCPSVRQNPRQVQRTFWTEARIKSSGILSLYFI